MKISLLSRDVSKHESQLAGQRKLHTRNLENREQPLIGIREYQRALIAAKMERIFAKPFVHAFEGHLDTVKSLARCNLSATDFFTGSCDGELRFWNLQTKLCQCAHPKAHEGFIEDICVNLDDKYVLTCGSDKLIKQWAVKKNIGYEAYHDSVPATEKDYIAPTLINSGGSIEQHTLAQQQLMLISTYAAESTLSGVDYHSEREWFASSGGTINVWDLARSSPFIIGGRGIHGDTNNDGYTFVKWSPSESHLLLSGSVNNTIGIFDTRQSMDLPCQKIGSLGARCNAGCWNPMKPFHMAVANDDGNVYTFDIRNPGLPRTTHSGFVHAALDVDFSPAGDELVAGSFDHTVRIWRSDSRKSREIYHNKRMQAVTAIRYSADSKHILSGSADFNVRVWKTHANERTDHVANSREAESIRKREALKKKFEHMPEVNKILTKRQVPKYIYNQTKKNRIASDAMRRKELNRQNASQQHAEKNSETFSDKSTPPEESATDSGTEDSSESDH